MTKKILIIEDEEILLELLQKRLAKEGYKVLTARDGEAGLRKIKESIPDLVLLDIVMPKMGGFEVIERINKNKKLKEIPIIIVSNSGQPVELEKAKKLGVKDCLVKTEFDAQEVVDKVKKQLDPLERFTKVF